MSPNGRGRILLISYHYGPNCETGGFRWTAMVPDLVAAGWSFDVITLARPAHRPPPHSSRAPAADAVEVFTLPAVAWPESLIEVLVGRARSALPSPRRPEHGNGTRPESVSLDDVGVWSPDTSVPLRSRLARLVYGTAQELSAWLWARRAAKLGRRLARHRDYDAVIVSTPPNLHHLAGVWISRRTGIPYIADYRDRPEHERPRDAHALLFVRRGGSTTDSLALCRSALRGAAPSNPPRQPPTGLRLACSIPGLNR